MEEQAEVRAILVPIQIDIDVDTFKIRDSFVWNLNGMQSALQFVPARAASAYVRDREQKKIGRAHV